MRNDLIGTIPLKPEYELPAAPEHSLSESDQKELAGILDLFLNRDEFGSQLFLRALNNHEDTWENAWRYQCESAVTVIMVQHAFNYHDESWTNYSVMRFERITQNEFEEMKKTANQADYSPPFDFLEGKASSCFVWKSDDLIWGKIHYYRDETGVSWDRLKIAYISGIPNVAGFFRLIEAEGDDRNFVN